MLYHFFVKQSSFGSFSFQLVISCFMLYRGCFSLVRDVESRHGAKARRVAKISVYDSSKPENSLREFEMLKAVTQEHVVRLHEAFLFNDFVILVFEKLYGESVARSLSLKNRYNEHTVTEIIKQVKCSK
jgi:hypothetical protein